MYENSRLYQTSRMFTMATLICGIIALVTAIFGMGFIAGGLGVVFFCLSRTGQPYPSYAKAGLALSLIGIFVSVALLGYIAWMLITGNYPPYFEEAMKMAEEYLGGIQ